MTPKLPRRLLCHVVLMLFGCIAGACSAAAQAGSKAEGARLFAASGCVHCHGATGEGTDSGPSLREVRRKLKPVQIERQITEGGGEMPAFGTALNPEQVKVLVVFLRAKSWVMTAQEATVK